MRLRTPFAWTCAVTALLMSTALDAQEPNESLIIHSMRHDVWRALVAVYQDDLEIPVSVSDSANGQLGHTGFIPRRNRIGGERLSRYLDCGRGLTGVYADRYQVIVAVLTTLQQLDGERLGLTTKVDATAKPRDTRGDPVRCTSLRTLEGRIGELVMERLGTPERTETTRDAGSRNSSFLGPAEHQPPLVP